jgi:hypothetical protein
VLGAKVPPRTMLKIFRSAQDGIYIPSSVGLYFSNLDSLLLAEKTKLTKEEIRLVEFLQTESFKKFNSKKRKKYAKELSELSTNESLRLCFYVIYDLERQKNKTEVIIIEWENKGRVRYSSGENRQMLDSIKNSITEAITNDCSFGVRKYSFSIVTRHGEVYPTLGIKDHYFKHYVNSVICQVTVGDIYNYTSSLFTNTSGKLIYAHLKVDCQSTVECPEEMIRNFNAGSASGNDH